MESFAAPFSAFADREPAELSEDERDSLEYYYASVNLAEGLAVDSPPRRWCAMAQNLGRIAHMLGRLPKLGDPGAIPAILEWIAEQRTEELNGYQRARLTSLPGGSALLN